MLPCTASFSFLHRIDANAYTAVYSRCARFRSRYISVEEMSEDFYAEEELMLGALSKCKKLGSKREEIDEVIEDGRR